MIWIARHLAWASLALIVIALLLGYAFVFRRQIAGLRQADRISRLNEERTAKEAYLKQLDALNAQYEAFGAEDIERARTMIPNEEDVPGILTMLEAAAQASDVQLTAVNFAAADTGGIDVQNVGAVSIAIGLAHGDYRRFKLFLETLQDNLRLFDVRSANINPASASYSLTIRAYVWRNPS